MFFARAMSAELTSLSLKWENISDWLYEIMEVPDADI
jgi:hypothetical protein